MKVDKTEAVWGKVDGKEVVEYTLSNESGMFVKVLNYGGSITDISVPDNNGSIANVVLSFDSLEGYLQKGNPCFGCLVGRYANRIAGASFSLEGRTYHLAANDNGNSLHGGTKGFDKVVWDVTRVSGNSVELTYFSEAGEEGYPGNLRISVLYSLSADNALKIEYEAEADAPTPVNFTNHAYFNLSGGAEDTILDHELTLKATRFTATDDKLIPTGEIHEVKGTALDFTVTKKLGTDIGMVSPGYDHNFVLDNETGELRSAGSLYHPSSGRFMEVETTQPGMQLYTGNYLDGSLQHTHKGAVYIKHAGLCLETQHYPDSPHQPSFPSVILHPGQKFHEVTVYRFSVK